MATPDPAGLAALSDLGSATPRLCRRRLPAYRHLPGLTPHPTADPRGHSYGRAEEPGSVPPPEDWPACEAYLFGCDLYNRGYWWEAHEAWEGPWQGCRARPAQHRFLQGLIQAANAQLKLALGRPQAVGRLWEKAEAHFEAAAAGRRFMGLALPDWRGATAHYLAARLAETPLRHDPAAYPLLRMHHCA